MPLGVSRSRFWLGGWAERAAPFLDETPDGERQ